MGSKHKDTRRKKSLYIIMFLLALLFTVFVLPSIMRPFSGATKKEPTHGEILAQLVENGIWAVGEPSVSRITGVEELKKSKPVIYGNAKDGQYEIRWPSLLVIYDYENNVVVNNLSISQIRLPE